jgi:hypothetical protein
LQIQCSEEKDQPVDQNEI